jgi:hypothetical protein
MNNAHHIVPVYYFLFKKPNFGKERQSFISVHGVSGPAASNSTLSRDTSPRLPEEGLYCKRPIQCLASSKILTPPLPHRPASVYPPAFGGGGRTHPLGGEGVGVSSLEDARHCSGLCICKYFVQVPIPRPFFSLIPFPNSSPLHHLHSVLFPSNRESKTKEQLLFGLPILLKWLVSVEPLSDYYEHRVRLFHSLQTIYNIGIPKKDLAKTQL